MTGPVSLRGILPNTPTPADLKAAREDLRVDLRYVSEALGLDVATLKAVEDGEVRAMDQVLVDWALAILRAPRARRSFWSRMFGSPWAVGFAAFVGAAAAVAPGVTLFVGMIVVGITVLLHGGR